MYDIYGFRSNREDHKREEVTERKWIALSPLVMSYEYSTEIIGGFESSRGEKETEEFLWCSTLSRLSDEALQDIINTNTESGKDNKSGNRGMLTLSLLIDSFEKNISVHDNMLSGTFNSSDMTLICKKVWFTCLFEMERRHRKITTMLGYGMPLESEMRFYGSYRNEYQNLAKDPQSTFNKLKELYT
jgi:hypothetical protein